uniref:F-box associated domain-containing protein n=1 Tax=Lactuca sativa TaxID=4236 RepID=A0A9R1WC34_LACSA|nr:hypothetical protein LSAT_V11C200056770 [Lactuca sativa]
MEKYRVSVCSVFASNNLDIDWLPHTCIILASSLCGLLVAESFDPNEYISKILFVIKPTSTDAKSIPFPTSEYTAAKFALFEPVTFQGHSIVIHKAIQWREFQYIQLPSSVYPVSDEAVTSGGVVYFLLSNDTILRFDIYSKEHKLIFAPSIINDFKPYASRLIKFHGKLRYFFESGYRLWAIWVFIHSWWVKVDVSTYNEGAHEW